MTLLDHVVLQVDDLKAIGDWYDQIVSLAGGTRTFDMPNLIGYALPGQPAQLFFSLATDPDGRQTHLALSVEDDVPVGTPLLSESSKPVVPFVFGAPAVGVNVSAASSAVIAVMVPDSE